MPSRVALSSAVQAGEYEYLAVTPSGTAVERPAGIMAGGAEPLAADGASSIYYGWLMIPLAMLVMICSAPGQTYGFVYFNPWLRQSLSLSQTELSTAYLLATLCAAAPLSYLGALSDRYGLKRSILTAVIAMAGACLFAATVQNAVMLFVACLGLRVIGAGLMSLLATNTLAVWFDRRLPLACGVMQFGMAASIALVPLGLMTLIDALGWRGAYASISAALALGLLPLLIIAYRERPSDVGQRIDGDVAPLSRREELEVGFSNSRRNFRLVDDDRPPSLSFAEALRTHLFWMLLIATAVWSLIGTGLMFHLESLLRARGLTTAQIAWATPLMAVSMAVVQLASSALVDNLSIRRLIAAALLATTAACLILATTSGPAALTAYSFYGIGQGLMTVVSSTSWAQHFGPAHLGRIRGTSMTVAISCSAIGPLAMGASVDWLNGFEPSLWFFAVVASFVAIGGEALGKES